MITDCINNRAMFYRNKASLCIERVVHAGGNRRLAYLEAVNSRFGQSCCDVDSFIEFVLSIRADQAAKIETMCEILGVDVEEYLAERKPYLTREQIVQLDREGFTIGASMWGAPADGLLLGQEGIGRLAWPRRDVV